MITDLQGVFKRYRSDKHLSEFYAQDGGKNQLAQIWNKITSLSPALIMDDMMDGSSSSIAGDVRDCFLPRRRRHNTNTCY